MQKIIRNLSPLRLPLFKIILLGIILRILTAIFCTHIYDSSHIIILARSVADTGSLLSGFLIAPGQLFGKIYYQIIALWMLLLNHFHLIHTNYIFDTLDYVVGRKNYLEYFPGLMPELSQLVLIKSISFLYDGILLYFLIRITQLLKPQQEKVITLFWAINPLFIYVGYVMLQSDLAMISLLTGGIYFTLKAMRDSRKISINAIIALLFFAVGALIKQVPLLIVPFVIVLFSETLWTGIIYTLIFAAMYAIAYQPWSVDALLLKKNFFNSPESTAIFNFGLNGLTIFFFLYLSIFAYFIGIRKQIKENSWLIICFILLIITTVFLSEDINSFFVQFSIWTMPFLAILALEDNIFALFLFGSLFGFYNKVLFDNSFLSGSLALSFGEVFQKLPTYNDVLSRLINPAIVTKLIATVFTMIYGALFAYLIYFIYKKRPLFLSEGVQRRIRISLSRISIYIFLIFIFIGIGEFVFMTHNALLTNQAYSDTLEQTLATKPIEIDIINPNKQSLNGVSIRIQAKQVKYDGHISLVVRDLTTHQILAVSKTSDFLIPDKATYFPLYFQHSVSPSKMQLTISEDNSINNIVVYRAKQYSFGGTTYLLYDIFYNRRDVTLKFPHQIIDANIIGTYSFTDMYQNFSTQFMRKPKVFTGYFLVIVILVAIILFPFGLFIRRKRQTS